MTKHLEKSKKEIFILANEFRVFQVVSVAIQNYLLWVFDFGVFIFSHNDMGTNSPQ